MRVFLGINEIIPIYFVDRETLMVHQLKHDLKFRWIIDDPHLQLSPHK